MAPMQTSLVKTQENLQSIIAAYNELATRQSQMSEDLAAAREENEQLKARLAEMESSRDAEKQKKREAASLAHMRKKALVTLFFQFRKVLQAIREEARETRVQAV